MRHRRALCVLSLAVAVVLALSLAVGPVEVAWADLWQALVGYDATSDAQLVVRTLRLPRALTALLVGAALAVAGGVMQAVTGNPLAGPTLMGLSGGASLFMLLALLWVPDLTYSQAICASLAGAAVALGCVVALTAGTPHQASPTRLTLAGVMLSALFSAITQGVLIAHAMANRLLFWSAGGIANVTWDQLALVLPCVGLGLAVAGWLAPSITVLSMGPEMAVGLGQRVVGVRLGATLSVLLLAGGAVAVAGPVAFVGLIVPHLGRLWGGADQRRSLPLTALIGALVTGLADLGVRALGDGSELPMGVVTAVLGAPIFVWWVHRHRGPSFGGRGARNDAVRVQLGRRRSLLWPLAAVLVLATLALHLGRLPLSPDRVWAGLWAEGVSQLSILIQQIRLPRVLLGLLMGAGLALGGAVFQGGVRNDLAEPGLLGVSAGAHLAVVLALGVLGPALLSSALILPLVGGLGALAAALAVALLSLHGQQSAGRLLLTGVAVSAALGAITLVASMQLGERTHEFAVAWGAGSLGMADWRSVAVLAVSVGVLGPLVWRQAAVLDVLRLGEPAAMGLGVAVPRMPYLLLMQAVLLCAVCMAMGGGVLFLGLIAPHIARRWVGPNHRVLLPASALVGAGLLLVADAAGRLVLPVAELPAGIMVSALGVPWFLYRLVRA